MTDTASELDRGSTAAVLEALRADHAARDAAEVARLLHTIDWAVLHEVRADDPSGWYAAHATGLVGDRGVPIAGDGAPLVSEFALMEYAAVLGMSTDAAKAYVGRALEIRYRLPRLWERVTAGRLPVWRAGRIAEHTMPLPEPGAREVDRHLAPVAHSCSWAMTERLVSEAMLRHDPEQAEADRLHAAEARRFDIATDRVTGAGTVFIDGELDLADALDLDAAISATARQLGRLGSAESLDVRRSIAAGEIARRQLALDLDGGQPSGQGSGGRGVTLHVHLTDATLHGPETVGRCDNTRTPVTVEQIRTWCGSAGARITVKPVIDLSDHVHVEAYEVPDRIKSRVELRDVHCAFPHCTRGAARCDCDHVDAHAAGGPTCSCNLAPLCRRHHRAKTHSAWTYRVITPGTYLWTSPTGYLVLRDHRGTHQAAPHPPDS